MYVSPAYAQSAGGFGSGFGSLVPLLLIVLIMYFLIIRPQMQQAKTHKKMIEDLKKGDQIITQGGLIGKISKINRFKVQQMQVISIATTKRTSLRTFVMAAPKPSV